MGTELDFNFDYDKAKQRQIRAKRNQTGSVGSGSSSGSGITTTQVNNLINAALQDYEESHPIPDPVTPNTTLLGTVEGDSLTDQELRTLVWHDEFNNGQFDPEKWNKTAYGATHVYTDGYTTETTEDGVYLKEKSYSTVGRLVSRQAFRNCTIKVRAKRLSLWLGTLMFDTDDIPTDKEIFYQEIDFCEKYNQNNNNVYCNTHSSQLDTTNNAVKVESTVTAITGHNFYADDNWHDIEIIISAPDATTGAINLVWKLDGTTIKTGSIGRQNLVSDTAIDQTIARQGIKIVLDKALGEPYNNNYEMPVIDYVRVFANESTAYREAIELGYISPQGTVVGIQKGAMMLDYFSTDTILELPSAFIGNLSAMGIDSTHIALVNAINSGEIYGINNSKKATSAFCLPPRLIAYPLDAPVVPEFKYVDMDVVYEKIKKDALVTYRFTDGDIRVITADWNLDSYDIKKAIISFGGDFYKLCTVRSLVGKLDYQANWTETNTNADGYIKNKPS